MSDGITHITVGSELTQAEWEVEGSHQLSSGTSFPGSPSEMDLFYRTDLHAWYIRDNGAWQPLGSSPGEANSYDLGGANNEWKDIYCGGILKLYTNQDEYLYSDDTDLIIGVGGSDRHLFGNTYARIGEEDAGNPNYIAISGGGTGQDEGGELRLETSADHDTTYPYWFIDIWQEDVLRIKASGGNFIFRLAESGGGQILIKNQTTGSSVDSPIFKLLGNYYDTSDHEIEGRFRVITGADPYILASISDDGASPSLVSVLRIYDTMVTPHTTNSIDLGSSSLVWKDAYVQGSLKLYSDQDEFLYSNGGAIIFGQGGSDRVYIGASDFSPITANTIDLGGADNEFKDAYIQGTINLYSDQAEKIRSDGNLMILTADANDTVYIDDGQVGIETSTMAGRLNIGNITTSIWGINATNNPGDGTTRYEYVGGYTTTDRTFRLINYTTGGSRYYFLTHNLKYDGTNFTQGNWGGSSIIKFQSGDILFFADAQDTGGSETNITPTEVLRVTPTGGVLSQAISPFTPNTYDLGWANYEWKDIYIQGEIKLYSDQQEFIRSPGTGIEFGAFGNAEMFLDNTALRPSVNNDIDLGNSTYQWKDLYVTGVSYLDQLFIENNPASMLFDDTGETDPAGEFRILSDNDLLNIQGRNSGDTGWDNTLTIERYAGGGQVTIYSIAASDGLVVDEPTTGSNVNSPYFRLRGNYYDGSNYVTIGRIHLVSGTDPYMVFAVSATGDAGTATTLLRMYDNVLAPAGTNTKDLGSSSLKWKDFHLAGNINVDGTVDTVDIANFKSTYDAHDHSSGDPTQVDHDNLTNVTGDQHHNESHILGTSGPHTGELPLTDLAAGSPGSIIKRGSSDWEEYPLGTTNYVLKAGATDVNWGQVAWGEITGKPSTFTPAAHEMVDSVHTDSGLTVGDVIRASGATTFAWAELQHADLGGVTSDLHHAEAHVLATTGPHTGSLPVSDMNINASIIPTATSYNLGSATFEWANIYIGTGRLYFAADQQESIRSDTTNMIFEVGDADELILSSSAIYPNSDAGLDLGTSTNRYGRIYALYGGETLWMYGTSANASGTINPAARIAEQGSSSYYLYGKRGSAHASEADDFMIVYYDGSQYDYLVQYDTSAEELLLGAGTAYRSVLSSTLLRPVVNAQISLGSDSYEFNDLWIEGIAYLDYVEMHGTLDLNGNNMIDFNWIGRSGIEATSGAIRLVNADSINWRNQGNTADLGISVDSSNRLNVNVTTLYMSNSPYNIKSAGDLLLCDTDLTASNQHDVVFFGDGANAQAGAFNNKIQIMGGSGQSRDFLLEQVVSGYARISTSWTSNYLEIHDNFLGIRPVITNDVDFGTNTLFWKDLYAHGWRLRDPAANNTYIGVVIEGTAAVALVIGDVVYLNSSGQWAKADADAESTAKGRLGMACESISASGTGTILLYGIIRHDDWAWTAGQELWISVTPGDPTTTKPSGSGDIVRLVGHTWDADAIIFDPDQTYIEIA